MHAPPKFLLLLSCCFVVACVALPSLRSELPRPWPFQEHSRIGAFHSSQLHDLQGSNVLMETAFKRLPMHVLMPADAEMAAAYDAEQRFPAFGSSSSNDTCGKCVHHASRCILKHSIGHVKKLCNNTKCPYLQKQCKFMKIHRDVALGMIIEWTRPMSLGIAYCIGAGECTHSNSTFSGYIPEREITSGIMEAESWSRALDESRALTSHFRSDVFGPNAAAFADRSPRVMAMATSIDSDESARGGETVTSGSDCGECIDFLGHEVMHHVLKYVHDRCGKTKCPHLKRWCDWSKDHEGIAFGMLLVKVRPDEWSCGYCFGKGICGQSSSNAAYLANHPNL